MIDLRKEGWNPQTFGDLDHRYVKAPYIRIANFKKGKHGDYVFIYDLRFTQPNKIYIKTEVLHSLEHFLLTGFNRYINNFVGVAPMGCQTGFYLYFLNNCNAQNIVFYLEEVLKDILFTDSVPLSNDIDCGQSCHHDLEGAKKLAKEMLEKKHEWLEVY